MTVEVLTLVLRLLVVVIAGVIVPAFKAWLNAKTENEKIARVKDAAKTAVYAAEQIYNTAEKADPDGELRRRFVKGAIMRVAYQAKIVLTDREIREIIEAAVQELNHITHKEN